MPLAACIRVLIAMFVCSNVPAFSKAQPPRVALWYGEVQQAGQLGEPQRWVNVLGNASPADQLQRLEVQLNEGEASSLSWGSNLHRLARAGDFNAEFAWHDLRRGTNTVRVTAYFRAGRKVSATTRLQVARGNTWPLPYRVDFTEVSNLQEVVQVVDGKWTLTEAGVRTAEPYYDRVLSMGDTSWQDYEALVHLTIHGFTPSEPGPPTYNVSHFGVAARWRGHHAEEGRQPSRKWFPLGAQGEFLLKEQPDSCRWRILYGAGEGAPPPTYGTNRKPLRQDAPMWVRMQVYTLPSGDTRYRFKQWMDAASEPIAWDVEGTEPGARDYPSGALCLVPHNSDLTIHSVEVQPLPLPPLQRASRPGPGALHRSAPVGGLMGSRGAPFEQEVIQEGEHLRRLSVNLGPPPLRLIRGIRFTVELPDGGQQERLIGLAEGDWQPPFDLPPKVQLIGMSGRSGWYLDALQFHFSDGRQTPLYGGDGGDTRFQLGLATQGGTPKGRIRGVYGTFDAQGLELLGLLFDPAE